MPVGCGTWPAVWETGESDWPMFGEVRRVATSLVTSLTYAFR